MNATLTNPRRFCVVAMLTLLGGIAAGRVWADDPTADATKPPQLRTEAVRRGDVDMIVRATGTLEPEQVVDVGSLVNGVIKRFGDDPDQADHQIGWNSKVEVGTVLAYMDDTYYKSAVETARATVEKARAEVHRAQASLKKATADYEVFRKAEKVLDKRGEPRPENFQVADLAYETAKASAELADAQLKLDQAALKHAETSLDNTCIRSPIKGVVIDRRATLGQAADPAAPSFFLVATDLAKMQIWMQVPEADIADIHKGQTVLFNADSRAEKLFEGQVDQIRLNATMAQNVVTYTVVVLVDNAKGELVPYGTVRTTMKVGHRAGVLLVPNAALSWSPYPAAPPSPAAAASKPPPANKAAAKPTHGRVWVLQEGKSPRAVEVKLGATDGTSTEITGGELKEGMQVIVGDAE